MNRSRCCSSHCACCIWSCCCCSGVSGFIRVWSLRSRDPCALVSGPVRRSLVFPSFVLHSVRVCRVRRAVRASSLSSVCSPLPLSPCLLSAQWRTTVKAATEPRAPTNGGERQDDTHDTATGHTTQHTRGGTAASRATGEGCARTRRSAWFVRSERDGAVRRGVV